MSHMTETLPFRVLNADGLAISDYAELAHARLAAAGNAQDAAELGDTTNAYSVTDAATEDADYGTWYADGRPADPGKVA